MPRGYGFNSTTCFIEYNGGTPTSEAGIPPPRENGSPHMDDGSRRAEHLRLFFELRDRKFTAIIKDLFRCYTFPDIAHGIYKKYKILPQGWQQDLNHLFSSGG